MITFQKYQVENKDIWDLVVMQAENNHFMFQRDYMDYHSDRFQDHSYLVFKDAQPIAVLPGCQKSDMWSSHAGLTFGGLILTAKSNRISLVCEIYKAFFGHLKNEKFKHAFIKPLPLIYHKIPCEGELYALSRETIVEQITEVTTTVDLRVGARASKLRKRQYKKAVNKGLTICKDNRYDIFWDILTARLGDKYETAPVHTLSEMQKLSAAFPDNISLYRVLDSDKNCVGGTVIFQTDTLWHAQYISANNAGMSSGALDLLFLSLIDEAQGSGVLYFDFGISTENNGAFLNEPLAAFKEGFGGRAIIHRKMRVEI